MQGNIEGYVCDRCGGDFGYFCYDGEDTAYFCGTRACLDADVEARKGTKVFGEQKKAEHISRFGLGSRFVNATLAKWRSSKSDQKKVLTWVRCPENFLISSGSPGIGKTFLCAALINYFADKKQEVFYTNARRYFEHIQNAMSKNIGHYESIQVFKEKEILIFDDLGASRNTDWQVEMVLDLIDYRYEHEMPTVFTSNYRPGEVKEIFGERVMRRLFNEDNQILVNFDSE